MLASLKKWLPSSPKRSIDAYRSRPGLETLEGRDMPALSVVSPVAAATLAQTLVGTGAAVSNATFTGAAQASGTFTGGTGIVGFASGVVLSTGRAASVANPNTGPGTGPSTNNNQPGDTNLNAIVAPAQTFDAAVLQFDFVTQATSLTFSYVFSSDEYPNFVNAGVNDVFGFYLNGQNVALLPGSATPITVGTVNANSNSQFFIDNSDGHLMTSMTGLTTVLQVTQAVTPGATNHIKLAIADGGDPLFDSNVFIQAGTFTVPATSAFQTYAPYRYAFRDLMPGQYVGNFTILNNGTAAAAGTLIATFPNLPPGVAILSALGGTVSGNSVAVPNVTLPVGVPYRLQVTFSNPLAQPLGDFYSGLPISVNVG